MKNLLFCASLFAAAFNAFAVALTPDEVTDQQIEGTKVAMDKGCREAGARRGYLPEKLDLVCGCASEVAEARLTLQQWQELYIYSRTNQKHKAATLHEALRPMIKVCIENAKSKPKVPAADKANVAP